MKRELQARSWSQLTPQISNINSPRHPIPDVPVLYLIEPTAANLNIVSQDLARNLYANAYLNFLSSIPRPLMEDFAAQIADAGTSEGVAQVYDQYLNFIVSEPDIFSLGMGRDTYWALNSSQTNDEDLDAVIDRIVSGLFSVAVTMGEKSPPASEGSAHPNFRSHTYHSVSARRSSRDDISKTRSKASRSHSKLERKSLLGTWVTTIVIDRKLLLAPGTDHC